MFPPIKYFLIYSFVFFIYSGSSTKLNDSLVERDSGTHEANSILDDSEETEDWGYGKENGPDHWGGLCKLGKNQSPINIESDSVKKKQFPPFEFHDSYFVKQKLLVENNGHTIKASMANDTAKIAVHGGGLHGRFILQQIHFHWESEHELDGKRADLEMHIVHYNDKYSSFSEAVEQPDGIAVFAIFFDISKQKEEGLEKFFDYMMKSVDDDDEEEEKNVEKLFSARSFLPKLPTTFYRYNGSLTTPGCNENVQWTVFKDRFPVSQKVINFLRNIPGGHGETLSRNYRPPQSLNCRDVYFQSSFAHTTGTNSIVKRLSIYLVFKAIYISKIN